MSFTITVTYTDTTGTTIRNFTLDYAEIANEDLTRDVWTAPIPMTRLPIMMDFVDIENVIRIQGAAHCSNSVDDTYKTVLEAKMAARALMTGGTGPVDAYKNMQITSVRITDGNTTWSIPDPTYFPDDKVILSKISYNENADLPFWLNISFEFLVGNML